ncbi:MAG: DUF2508 family protein [Clostridium sulfidigenes]|uniref:DUF2508 family protein n=2 Tax=Clostridium TaxID=1485 RepID=A0A927WAT1_9CLOT|nr:DUF2508 family protein [Clostridium sulfidigenes]HAR85552.1 DUF2508 domain-containing protein [Clostridium sp.]
MSKIYLSIYNGGIIMNRDKIIETILAKNIYTPEQREIIKGIQDSITEIEVARSCFDNVSDKSLIDISIYKEDEAKAKYVYFLNQAKKSGITVGVDCMIEELNYCNKW